MLEGDSNPNPQNQLELKVRASIHWTTSSLKAVYIPSLWRLTVFKDDSFGFIINFRVELNLQLIEDRRKAHNKPIITHSGLVHAGESLRNL